MSLKGVAKKILGEKKWVKLKILPLGTLGVIDHFRSLKNTWGGPFNGQIFRQQIYLELIRKIGFSAIVETGTFRGDNWVRMTLVDTKVEVQY